MPLTAAEIIPFVPDQDNACVWKKQIGTISLPKVVIVPLVQPGLMNIYINNEPQKMQGPSSIADALAAIGVTAQKGIAIAINNNVIPKTEWDTHTLNGEDRVTIIKATQGG